MKHKPDASWNAGPTDRRGVRQSLTRAGVQLGYAVTGALTSSLEALEERLESGPPASGGTAQSRMRELLTRDRAALHTRRGRAAAGAQPDEPAFGFTGKQSGGTARGRMRELLHKDRAMIATLDDEPFSDLFEQSGTMSLPAAPASRSVAPPAAVPSPVPMVAALQAAVSLPAPIAAPSPAQSGVVPALQAPVVAALQAAVGPAPRSVAVIQAPVMIGIAPSMMSTRPAAVAAPAPVPAPVIAPVTPTALATVEPIEPAAPPVVASAPKAAPRAMPVLSNQAPVGSAPAPALAGDGGDSPIRTRSMARLLALQGYRERALSIYDELLIVEPDNADLRAEADRLRA